MALLIYAIVPVPFNALGEGRWSSLAMWAGTPWIIGLLGRAAGSMPFAPTGQRLNPLKAAVGLSVCGALVAMVFPAIPVYLVIIAAHETAQGRQVCDVHEQNLGYDITSLDVRSGELRR